MGISRGIGWSIPGGPMGIGANGGGGIGATGVIAGGAGMGGPTLLRPLVLEGSAGMVMGGVGAGVRCSLGDGGRPNCFRECL